MHPNYLKESKQWYQKLVTESQNLFTIKGPKASEKKFYSWR
jgi:hypothetical protein